jgi:hypothetical protein
MKQVHKGLLCQYCLKLFKRVVDLDQHMKAAHKVTRSYFPTVSAFQSGSGLNRENSALVCATCSAMVRIADLERHACLKKRAPSFDCPFCERHFSYQNQLDLHLCNGWCKAMKGWQRSPPTLEDTAKMYNMLTGGLDLCQEQEKEDFFQPKSILHDTLTSSAPGKRKAANAFSISDKHLLARFAEIPPASKKRKMEDAMIEGLPSSGSIFCGKRSRGVNNHVKKEFKDTGYNFNLRNKMREAGIEEVGGFLDGVDITKAGQHFIVETPLTKRVSEAAAAAEASQRLVRETFYFLNFLQVPLRHFSYTYVLDKPIAHTRRAVSEITPRRLHSPHRLDLPKSLVPAFLLCVEAFPPP